MQGNVSIDIWRNQWMDKVNKTQVNDTKALDFILWGYGKLLEENKRKNKR